jgi:protein SCO1
VKKVRGEQKAMSRESAREKAVFVIGLFLLIAHCAPLLAFAQQQRSAGLYGRPPEEARADYEPPQGLRGIGFEQRLNEQIPLDAVFRDERGREVRLGEYFNQGRPVLLAPVYFDCPMLCIQVMSGIATTLNAIPFVPGRDFDVVLVSFDPRETPELAARNKERYLRRYGHAETAGGWHFLTGEENSVRQVTDAIGFNYRWDAETEQFAHAAGIVILTSEGRISRYFYGIEYMPRDVRFGLIEASERRIGSPVDRMLLLYCYHYDPNSGRYGPVVMNIIRAGGILTIIGFAVLYTILRWWRPRRTTAS